MNKKSIPEIFGTGAVVANGYLRIPKSGWANITVAAVNNPLQILLAIVEKANDNDSTVDCIYQDTVTLNDKINGDNISGYYNRYLIRLTGLNKAKNINPNEF